MIAARYMRRATGIWTPRNGIADLMYFCIDGARHGSAASASPVRTATTSGCLLISLTSPSSHRAAAAEKVRT